MKKKLHFGSWLVQTSHFECIALMVVDIKDFCSSVKGLFNGELYFENCFDHSMILVTECVAERAFNQIIHLTLSK